MNCLNLISTTRPPFRVGYRRRSTVITTKKPSPLNSTSSTTYSTTPSSRLTKRRKVLLPTSSSRSTTTTSRTAEESQVITTQNPRFTNRFRFVSRKPYLRTTTPKKVSFNTTDQTLEPTNEQTLENGSLINTAATELADIATALYKIQQAPIPQAKPSRKRPQILRLSAQYTTRLTTEKPTISTTKAPKKIASINKKTLAITLPFLRGTYVTSPQTYTADRYAPNIVTAAPLIRDVYESPLTITAQDYVNKYTSTRSKSRFALTEEPLIVINSSPTSVARRKKPTQPFHKVAVSTAEAKNTYRPRTDYDYYDDIEASILGKIPEHSKVLLHGNGIIECLDQGNFPHPVSCKKFISCAKMDNDKIVGWEYTCPKNLSFDPIGGMCNWSAGLGCNEA